MLALFFFWPALSGLDLVLRLFNAPGSNRDGRPHMQSVTAILQPNTSVLKGKVKVAEGLALEADVAVSSQWPPRYVGAPTPRFRA
jgi:hypothetical protein